MVPKESKREMNPTAHVSRVHSYDICIISPYHKVLYNVVVTKHKI